MSSNVSLLVGGSGGACSRFAPIYPSRRPAGATVEPPQARRHALIRQPPLLTAVEEQASASSHPLGPFNGL
ncbi:DNA topoisomerase 2 [Clarias magur]|uniref:DNA topoisomerase 2 n=1 Tax=Clarias magur TaxID=1594786 RepID=A0A8J4XHC7_CLAMG|nr:DNA topoisomerase 2 [Clarias magur]